MGKAIFKRNYEFLYKIICLLPPLRVGRNLVGKVVFKRNNVIFVQNSSISLPPCAGKRNLVGKAVFKRNCENFVRNYLFLLPRVVGEENPAEFAPSPFPRPAKKLAGLAQISFFPLRAGRAPLNYRCLKSARWRWAFPRAPTFRAAKSSPKQ